MAVTDLQRLVCRLLADARRSRHESYIAGGVALNAKLRTPRLSRDIDIFHDTAEALQSSWQTDRALLESHGLQVEPLREQPWFVEARIRRQSEAVVIQWTRDSAFRFFPLVEDPDFGLVLHPFDLATNKVLALVGRLEPRDWIDVLECDARLQPLGYLAWAASGKDPGFSPRGILAEAARSGRYSAEELASLDFDGPPPDPADLSRRWHSALRNAAEICDLLPPASVGCCVLDGATGVLFQGSPEELGPALREGRIVFHRGHLGGSVPSLPG